MIFDSYHLIHLLIGLAIAALGLKWPPFIALAFAAGPLKELSDWADNARHTNPDWIDLLFTWTGATIGWLFVAIAKGLQHIAQILSRAQRP